MDKLKFSTEMLKFFCITDLISFMMNEAEKLMKRSVHGEYLSIVHDALVLLTEKETINCIRKTVTYINDCFPSMQCTKLLLTLAVLLVLSPISYIYITH